MPLAIFCARGGGPGRAFSSASSPRSPRFDASAQRIHQVDDAARWRRLLHRLHWPAGLLLLQQLDQCILGVVHKLGRSSNHRPRLMGC